MLEQLLYSGKLGDGCLVHRAKTSVIKFSSKCLNYLIHKKVILESNYIKTSSITYGKSGYTGKYNIAKFSSYSDLKIERVYNMTKVECIKSLDKIGLIYLFLDDGSLHKSAKFGNIYCNSFTDEEVEALIDKIWELYPIKRCSKLYDKKKDGRCYPYIYISKFTMKLFLKDISEFVTKYNITDMFYKADLPSTTIPDGSTSK